MDIRAILFDLADTLTKTQSSVLELIRVIAILHSIDISPYTNDQLNRAFSKPDAEMNRQLVRQNVHALWGGTAEDWLPFDRMFFETLGIHSLSDELILEFENEFKHRTKETDWEYFTHDALETISELKDLDFSLGICTRRHDNPSGLLARHGLTDCFKAVQWSGVPGYRKPSPYTLLMAAREIGVNPRHCVFVGNCVDVDVEAALRCEMVPVLLTWANPHEAEKAPKGTIVLEQPSDLISWLHSPNDSS